MKKLHKNTAEAVARRIANGEWSFYIGRYFYVYSFGRLRRREQRPGYTPTSDWELIGYIE